MVLAAVGVALVVFGAVVLIRYHDRPGGVLKLAGLEVSSVGAGLPLICLGVLVLGAASFGPGPDHDSATTVDTTSSTETPPPTGSPGPTSSTSPSTTAPPLPPGTEGVTVRATCEGMRPEMVHGEEVRMTYQITVEGRPGRVGLGAGFYDEVGTDFSNGDHDVASSAVPTGVSTHRRLFVIPDEAPIDRSYELSAEVWPADRIGQGEALDDDSCGEILVIE